MGASRYVGRVGGLAVALGVGAAMFSGHGVAFADAGDGGSDNATPARAARDTAAPRSEAAGRLQTRNNSAPRAGASAPRINLTPAAPAASETGNSARLAAMLIAPAADNGPGSQGAEPSGSGGVEPVVVDVPEPVAAEPDSIADVAYSGTGESSDETGSGPIAPLDETLAWAVMYAARRDSLLGANAAEYGTDRITFAPTTALVNGVFQGTLNASSTTGQDLVYSFVGSSNGGKLDLGLVPIPGTNPTAYDPQSYTILPYANWLDGAQKGTQTFNVRVTEVTGFDRFVTGIPLLGLLASPIIGLLQQAPLISGLLAPIIGASVLAPIPVNVGRDAPGDTPVAFTYKVASFDGTLISANFFPANGLQAGATAPTLLNGPGLGGAGNTDPYAFAVTSYTVPGLPLLRGAGYNVVTWDPRGEFASGGILQLDNPFYEGRDVSALISWLANGNTPAVLDGPDDPLLGMVGGSYGGAIQMSTVDTRIDIIAPTITWNSLNESLYPSSVFKTGWANVFALSLLTTGARVNSLVYPSVITGNLFGFLSQTAQALLGSSGPTVLLNQLQVPTMLLQGTVDALFPLVQSIENAQTILANPFDNAVKMVWFCGGHGVCLDTGVNQIDQLTKMFTEELTFLAIGLQGAPIPYAVLPNFRWWDQAGGEFSSNLYPFSPGFNQATPLSATGAGGRLFIFPIIGGSGPNTTGSCDVADACSWPLNQVFATKARNAINVDITPTVGDQIVGAPTVSFDYCGRGNSRAVFGQIVDNATGRVLGNIAAPIPVILDGQPHSVTVNLSDIVYTAQANPSLTLQIVGSATLFENSSLGMINISNVKVDLPLRAVTVGALV